MPDMMGVELLSAIRASRAASDLLFMMVTAESERKSAVEALDAGANEVVVKPVSSAVMRSKLEEMLNQR